MRIRAAWIVVAGLTASAVADDLSDDRKLIAQTSSAPRAAVTAEPAQQARPADEIDRLEAQARIDLAVSQARLDLVLARKALQARRYDEAIERARAALAGFKNVPRELDFSVPELQAEGIIARATRLSGKPVLFDDVQETDANTQRETQDMGPDDPAARRAQAAAKVARGYTGADIAEIDTRGDAGTLLDRALRHQVPNAHGYRPGREIIDVQAVIDRDQQRLYYEDVLRTTYKANEARLLTEADEARVTPDGIVSYPDNWPEIVKKRERYKDGVIARTPSWTDKDGREWYVAIYDIHDLIYVPPDFQNTAGIGLLPDESLRVALDRHALRHYSQIFSGGAEDLAAGIPLLRYFGGIDDFEYRGPKYSLERQQEIINMIKAFTGELSAGEESGSISAPAAGDVGRGKPMLRATGG